MSKPFSKLPHSPSIKLHEFKVHQPQADIDRLRRKLDDVEEIRTTYENSYAPDEYELGLKKDWVESMLYDWRAFDWRKTEEEINTFNNYTATLQTRGHTCSVHFVGLFSEKEDAVPVVFTHGWPGSFIEFLPMLQHLRDTYTPETLPIHAIVPSLVGFGFSAPPPRHDRFTNLDTATLWDQLMRGLGFESYVAQGGDIGSYVTRLLGEKFDACKAIHINLFRPPPGTEFKTDGLDEFDTACVERLNYFNQYEFAYRNEHATKPATIGLVVESSPVALLGWIGEKMLRWSDKPPSSHHILSNITLYYLTRTFSTSLYHYWSAPPSAHVDAESQPDSKKLKAKGTPVGYSLFQKEILPTPIEWVKGEVNMVWSKKHDQGGHFAALEKPVDLVEDVLDFLNVAWKP